MSFLSKPVTLIAVILVLFMQPGVEAAMVGTSDMLLQGERMRLIEMMDREEVKSQLIDMGVDHDAARDRVNRMTADELAELNGQIETLPAGAASTTELLLIIIILILLL